VVGAVAGLTVAAAIVGPAALADNGGNASAPARAKAAGAPAPGGVPHQFLDTVSQAVQAGTINAAQARVLDAHILAGRIDPDALVRAGVLSAAQMQTVSDRLIAVKKGLAAQAQPDALREKAGAQSPVSCAAAKSVRGKAAG
jgi:hypothetical protein